MNVVDRNSAVSHYFATMAAALAGLEQFFGQTDRRFGEKGPPTLHMLPYLDRLRNSFTSWQNRIGFTGQFKIAQAESGFPIFQNVLELENDRAGAATRLSTIPDVDKLREEMTLAQIDHHAEAIEELDVQGILAFTERVLPRAADLWVQGSLNQKQRLQQLFLPEGIAFDGNRFNRTGATAPFFKYLAPGETREERLVSPEGIEP